MGLQIAQEMAYNGESSKPKVVPDRKADAGQKDFTAGGSGFFKTYVRSKIHFS
jgi:hypothetical protein